MNLNISGVWKGNLEKSKLLGPAPKAVLVKINHADPELIVEMVIIKMDDTEDRVLFRVSLVARKSPTPFTVSKFGVGRIG
ncbi:MAG: hypothetical protein DMG56_23640 [Acidobacteria bacterium]|nr:MAG: hypothetical protein DMG56_23640 [Acidobacteriota bacterium]